MMRLALGLLAAIITLSACSSESALTGLEPQTQSGVYAVTVSNLTTHQAFTPPVAATHRPAVHAFQVGEVASFGVKEIAENGNVAPLAEALGGNKHVAEALLALGDPPPILPGESRTFMISSSLGANRLSFVSMLICTNDGFTGLDSLRLPTQVGQPVTVYTNAYDAGTEINTEDFATMVPPCQLLGGVSSGEAGTGMSDPALAEGGVIHPHSGINGGSDLLPEIHGWTDPVAQVTVERLE